MITISEKMQKQLLRELKKQGDGAKQGIIFFIIIYCMFLFAMAAFGMFMGYAFS